MNFWKAFPAIVGAVFLGLFALDNPALARKTEIPVIAPPTPVECKNAENCDHDTQHLERFVADFYKWYVASTNASFSPSWQELPVEVFKKRRKERDAEEYHVLKKLLTPDFLAWRDKSLQNFDTGLLDPRYCSPDVDAITCAQDGFDEWMTDASAQLLAIEQDYAMLIVNLPRPDEAILAGPDKVMKNAPYQLSVRMQPIDGIWRIDGVIRLSYYPD